MASSEPGTARQRVIDALLYTSVVGRPMNEPAAEEWVDELEKQVRVKAIAAERQRVREAVEGLHRPGRSDINYRALLAIIDGAS